ncbi:hypothetical protein ONR75_03085 [Rhodopseudomonas sp. P2A-2r]|uniref:hypothetical protein n=1 Tax=Rhodopseudomonas sp. P2A-2r TaxID=2991972 RepID=UPI0022340E4B|nr:hypothetical protein [Rhodopseudomonas sp. P2A-2r]UZE49797.1 hypothetical protein ONR75_03085 [Rhodopseudomonas sp. P2A-2r]
MFTPWVGADWGKENNAVGGRRILLLGESHYESGGALIGKDTCRWDIGDLRRVCSGRENSAVLHEADADRIGKKKWSMTRDEVRAIWDSVVFYNYVPVYVAEGPRVSPTNEMFEMGVEPFNRILERFKPEVIVVCGHRLWWPLLKGQKFDGDPGALDTFIIGDALAMKMKHPSTAFSSEKWHAVLQCHLL